MRCSIASRYRAMTLVFLSLFATACGLSGYSELSSPQNICSNDSDCVEGTCNQSLHTCVADSNEALQFGVRLRPALGERNSVPISFVIPTQAFNNEAAIILPSVRTLRVNVRNNGRAMPADMRIETVGEVGPPIGAATFRASSDVGRTADFEVDLPDQRTFRMIVEPTGEARQQIPPFYATLDAEAQLPELLVLEHDELINLRGVIETTRENAQLSVRAVSATGELISSVDTGHALDGNPTHYGFSLYLADVPEGTRLRIDPSPEARMERPFPTVQIPVRFLLPDREGLVHILAPNFGMPVVVRGNVDDNGSVAANSTLVFRSADVEDPITHAVGALEAQVTTDFDGNYETVLYPGDYSVTITSAGIGVVLVVPSLQVTGDLRRDFSLPRGNSVTGIARARDQYLIGGMVRTSLVSATDTSAMIAPIGPWGQFITFLNRGVYDAVLLPPTNSMYAARVLPEVMLSEGIELDLGSLEIGAPRMLELRVHPADLSASINRFESTWFVQRESNGIRRWVTLHDQTLTTQQSNLVPVPAALPE